MPLPFQTVERTLDGAVDNTLSILDMFSFGEERNLDMLPWWQDGLDLNIITNELYVDET